MPESNPPIEFRLLGKQEAPEQEEQLQFVAELDREQREFQGHFPQVPLVPGVVQVDRAIHLQPWYNHSDFVRLDQVKFKDMILPGTELTLVLTHRGEGKVQFEYSITEEDGNRGMSSGTLVFVANGVSATAGGLTASGATGSDAGGKR